MAWFYLLLAGALEVCWAVKLKWAVNHPSGRWWPLILIFIVSIGSFLCLARAMKDLPLGTSYVIWTGIGAVGATVWGMVYEKEPADAWRLLCIGMVIAGVMGLKYVTPAEAKTAKLSDAQNTYAR